MTCAVIVWPKRKSAAENSMFENSSITLHLWKYFPIHVLAWFLQQPCKRQSEDFFLQLRVLRDTGDMSYSVIQLVIKPIFSPSALTFPKGALTALSFLCTFQNRTIPSPARGLNQKIKLILKGSWNYENEQWHTVAADWETSVVSTIQHYSNEL